MSALVQEACLGELQTEMLGQRATVLRGAVARWTACREWTPDRFRRTQSNPEVVVKGFGKAGPVTSKMRLAEYADRLMDGAWEKPLYLHDVPVFLLLPELIEEVGDLPKGILPNWYAREWWKFAQFFLGPDGATTPLHFDTLLTYNLFFHLQGRKTFTLIDWRQRDRCERRRWRWFGLDPDRSDFAAEAQERGIEFAQVTLNPGDVLLMPPGMLHHVRSYGTTASFNIDFHTRSSAFTSLARSFGRAPSINLAYSAAALAGVTGLAPAAASRVYGPYLNYVS
jgi:hypothetical protein